MNCVFITIYRQRFEDGVAARRCRSVCLSVVGHTVSGRLVCLRRAARHR